MIDNVTKLREVQLELLREFKRVCTEVLGARAS